MRQPLIIITGPTASGKTALSVELAKRIGGEIISADSMQVYRHMDVGSAKVTKSEMDGVPHHLIDVLDPQDAFNVVVFQNLAKKAMDEIYKKGHVPIIAGGTGFYIQAVLYDINFSKDDDNHKIREELEGLAKEKGVEYLHEELLKIDPASADAIHANNVKRVIRALEYFKLTGQKISEHNEEQREKESPYDFSYFVLNDHRELLYERIDKRVDEMVTEGLVEEVQQLKNMGYDRSFVSMQGLGYKEILSYLEGEISLEEAIYIIKRDTRHFAKRQITWFKREKEVTWVNKPEFDYDNERILNFMQEKIFLR